MQAPWRFSANKPSEAKRDHQRLLGCFYHRVPVHQDADRFLLGTVLVAFEQEGETEISAARKPHDAAQLGKNQSFSDDMRSLFWDPCHDFHVCDGLPDQLECPFQSVEYSAGYLSLANHKTNTAHGAIADLTSAATPLAATSTAAFHPEVAS